MPVAHIERDVAIPKSFRTDLVSSLYDLPPEAKSHREWDVHLPIEDFAWQIGLIVGPSGVGKSVIAQALWGASYVRGYAWDERSILDHFPAHLQGREIVALLTSVGFSSPPDWIKPYAVLSTGQQMRADLARALAEATASADEDGTPAHRNHLVVFDEFTSVVDRTVARVGSAALAKAVRRRPGQQFIAVTCHEDVAEWLTPDWVYEPATDTFTRRSLCPGWDKRPAIELDITRTDYGAWRVFAPYHYLSADLNLHAMCFLARWDGTPVGFLAVLPVVGFRDAFRSTRTVVLPDFQGVGIGGALSDGMAEYFHQQGKRFRSTVSHPALIRHRQASPHWRLVSAKAVGFARNNTGRARQITTGSSLGRSVVTHEYVGTPPQRATEDEERFNARECKHTDDGASGRGDGAADMLPQLHVVGAG